MSQSNCTKIPQPADTDESSNTESQPSSPAETLSDSRQSNSGSPLKSSKNHNNAVAKQESEKTGSIFSISMEEKSGSIEPFSEVDLVDNQGAFPEGGYGWLVVLGTFIINATTLGSNYCWGIYQRYYLTHVFPGQASNSTLSFIGTMSTSLVFLLGPISPMLMKRFGIKSLMGTGTFICAISVIAASFSTKLWHIYLTQGFLWGIGCSLVFYPGINAPAQWFNKRRGLAIGLGIAGSGTGGLVYAPIMARVIEPLGFRWTIRIFGGWGVFLLCLATILIRHPPNFKPPLGENSKKVFDFEAIRHPEFAGLLIAAFFVPFGYFVPFYLLPSYASFVGVSSGDAGILVGVASGMNAIGRVILGYSADVVGRVNTFFICSLTAGLAPILIWTFAKDFASLMVFAIIYGMSGGGFVSLFPVVCADIVGMDRYSAALGILYFCSAFGNTVGTPIAGALLDLTKPDTTYVPAIAYSSALTILGTLGLLWTRYRVDKRLFVRI